MCYLTMSMTIIVHCLIITRSVHICVKIRYNQTVFYTKTYIRVIEKKIIPRILYLTITYILVIYIYIKSFNYFYNLYVYKFT